MSKTLPDMYFRLTNVRDLIATPDRWCKYRFTSLTGQVCLDTAVNIVSPDYEETKQLLLDAAQDLFKHRYSSLESLNDQKWVTHEHVLKVIDRAMQLSLEEKCAA